MVALVTVDVLYGSATRPARNGVRRVDSLNTSIDGRLVATYRRQAILLKRRNLPEGADSTDAHGKVFFRHLFPVADEERHRLARTRQRVEVVRFRRNTHVRPAVRFRQCMRNSLCRCHRRIGRFGRWKLLQHDRAAAACCHDGREKIVPLLLGEVAGAARPEKFVQSVGDLTAEGWPYRRVQAVKILQSCERL